MFRKHKKAHSVRINDNFVDFVIVGLKGKMRVRVLKAIEDELFEDLKVTCTYHSIGFIRVSYTDERDMGRFITDKVLKIIGDIAGIKIFWNSALVVTDNRMASRTRA